MRPRTTTFNLNAANGNRHYSNPCSLECYNSCNKAYFPELECKDLGRVSFFYNHNQYDSLYIFSRPDQQTNGAQAVEDYETCKSYILSNPEYAMANSNPRRQIRTHTCFSYCANGEDYSFLGDDRPQCVDIPPSERD